jgi:hypothetical protein
MLQDSPPERLKYRYKMWEYINGIRLTPIGKSMYADLSTEPEPETDFDLAPFQHKNANMLNDVANFSSASASVFSSAIDRFDEARGDYLFASPMAGPYLINNALGRSHAFDEGNSRAVKWIEERRSDVLAQIDRQNVFYPAFLPEPLQELSSAKSYEIQAADIAASIARELWYRNTLPYLLLHFDYVTYNGERLSEGQATSYQHLISTSSN